MRQRVARALRQVAERLAPAPSPGIDLQVFREDGLWKRPLGVTGCAVYVEGAQGGSADGIPGRDGLVVVASLVPAQPGNQPVAALKDGEPVKVGGGGGSGRHTPEEVRAMQAQKFGRRADGGSIRYGGGGGTTNGTSSGGNGGTEILTLRGGKGGAGGQWGVNGGRGGDGQPGETVTGQFS